jgi:PHD/YefM family antitoxin component YafN of YafNO toxin-antitoxin module
MLKQTFLGKEVAITVEEVPDETEYLLSNEANRQHLLQAVEDIKQGRNVHTMSIEEMESMIG